MKKRYTEKQIIKILNEDPVGMKVLDEPTKEVDYMSSSIPSAQMSFAISSSSGCELIIAMKEKILLQWTPCNA